MDSINERQFEEKEIAYLSEKRHLENQLEQTYEEKRAFHNYLDHLANYVNYPTPHYDVPLISRSFIVYSQTAKKKLTNGFVKSN